MLLCSYPQVHYQTVYYRSVIQGPITRLTTTVRLHTDPLPDYTTVRLPRDLLPDCILLFSYPQAHFHIVYYCSATQRTTTRLYTTVRLPRRYYQTIYYCSDTKPTGPYYCSDTKPTGPLPDCIPLFRYPHANYQTIYY